jgi:transmembrane sensor
MHDPTTLAARRIAEEAGQWLLASREGLDEASRVTFVNWLRHSPAHVAEYMAAVQLDQDMKEAAVREPVAASVLIAQAASEPAVVALRPGAMSPARRARSSHVAGRARRWPWIAGALTMAAAVALVVLTAWPRQDAPPGIVYTAPTDAVRSIDLADGSHIQLDRGSRIRVDLGTAGRDIAVLDGTMMLDVGHRSGAPLTVTLGRSVLRDIGTVFQVTATPGTGEVIVLSGQVDVMAPRDDRPWSWTAKSASQVVAHLKAGEHATLASDGSLTHLEPHADLSTDLAWLPADIDFHDAPVADVARRFNHYGQALLLIDDAQVAGMRISGRFHARDPSGFIAYLQTFPGVQVRRDGAGTHIVRRGHGGAAARL